MKKVLEKAKESKSFTVMSCILGALLSVHPLYYLATSYFLCGLFNVLLILCVFVCLKLRGELRNDLSIQKLYKMSRDHIEVIVLLYCAASTAGYAIGKLFIVVF